MINFPWNWKISDGFPAAGVEYHGSRVFSCFSCGGGSSFGYKLAGFNVLGGVEIDKPIHDIYQKNHHPKFLFNEDIRIFLKRKDLPRELFNLDILDGSPPCTPFSMAGIREDGWGVERKYAEGRVLQTLDDLFFVFIELAKVLQPKIIVIENVPGLNIGKAAKKYMPQIIDAIDDAGYDCIFKTLDSSRMGVPQKRKRIFFLCVRKDLNIKKTGIFKTVPRINLNFNQPAIPAKDILDDADIKEAGETRGRELWGKAGVGGAFSDHVSGGGWFQHSRLSPNLPVPTLVCGCPHGSWHPHICRILNKNEWINASTFPQDYEFDGKHHYIIGNSVPPVMMANLSHQIYLQWLKNL